MALLDAAVGAGAVITAAASGDELFPAVPQGPTAVAGDARATVTDRQGTVGLGTGGAVTSFTITANPGSATCTATATNAAGTSAVSAECAAVNPTARRTTPIARLGTRIQCDAGRCVTTTARSTGATVAKSVKRVRVSRTAPPPVTG